MRQGCQSTMLRPEVIAIGMTASLSGRYAEQGTQALAGAHAWVEDTNRTGGISLEPEGGPVSVRLVFYDDESDPRRCEALTERQIIEDKVDILLGPYSSGLSLTAATVAERYGRVLWNHGGASDSIYQRGLRCVVGILTPASRYFHGIIEMVRSVHPNAESVAIVYSTAWVFPEDVALGAEEYSRQRGFHMVRRYSYAAGTPDFLPILRRLKGDCPDLILGVGRIEDDLRFAKQLHDQRVPFREVGLVATPIVSFKEVLGSAAESFLGPSQWEPGGALHADYGPSPEMVLKRLSTLRARGVDYIMAQAYAGCLVAQRCGEATGSLDNFKLRQAAEGLDFTTFYGRFQIDPSTGRQVGHAMVVVRWQGGKKVVVWPRRRVGR